MHIMWKNQRCIFILSGFFWQRNQNMPYFVRALYFVRWWTISRSKIVDSWRFSPPNCFPITPPVNGNLGSGYKYLLESGFKVGENLLMPKKSPAKFWHKIKTYFLQHDYFPLLKLKMWFFVQECAAELPLFIFCKNYFSKILFFLTDIVADMAVFYTLCARYTLRPQYEATVFQVKKINFLLS